MLPSRPPALTDRSFVTHFLMWSSSCFFNVVSIHFSSPSSSSILRYQKVTTSYTHFENTHAHRVQERTCGPWQQWGRWPPALAVAAGSVSADRAPQRPWERLWTDAEPGGELHSLQTAASPGRGHNTGSGLMVNKKITLWPSSLRFIIHILDIYTSGAFWISVCVDVHLTGIYRQHRRNSAHHSPHLQLTRQQLRAHLIRSQVELVFPFSDFTIGSCRHLLMDGDRGQNWTPHSFPQQPPLYAVWCGTNSDCLVDTQCKHKHNV